MMWMGILCLTACSGTQVVLPSALQQGDVDELATVAVEGVVVTAVQGDSGLYVSEPDGGAYSGVFVWLGVQGNAAEYAVGDVLDVSGPYVEYSDGWDGTLTEIDATQGAITPVSTGGEVAPTLVDKDDFADDATAERWESVLITIESIDVLVNRDEYDDAVLEHDLELRRDPVDFGDLGESLSSVTGAVGYNGAGFFLWPRTAEDVVP